MFLSSRKTSDSHKTAKTYDHETQKPILHKSICSGETTAGFKDLKTGKFMDIMLIKDKTDLDEFMKTYGIDRIPETEY